MPKDVSDPRPDGLIFRKPTRADGPAIHALIDRCAPLDTNSMYCNLLQSHHFRDTCVVVERAGDVVGWISGYLLPGDDSTLFVWQVAVDETARGHGLGGRMLRHIVTRPECRDVTSLQTTITADNAASWALFEGFARRLGATLDSAPHFERDAHFGGAHATEHMVTIALAQPLRRAA